MPDSRVETAIHQTQDDAHKYGATLTLKGVAQNITCPLFIVAGKLDGIVPWQDGEKLAHAAKGAVDFVLARRRQSCGE